MAHSKDEEALLDPTEQIQNCPLCQKPAAYKIFDFGRQKIFYCDTCTSFAIYTDAEGNVSELSKPNRERFSQRAKECDENTILVINVKRELGDIVNTSRGPIEVYYATVYPRYKPKGN